MTMQEILKEVNDKYNKARDEQVYAEREGDWEDTSKLARNVAFLSVAVNVLAKVHWQGDES